MASTPRAGASNQHWVTSVDVAGEVEAYSHGWIPNSRQHVPCIATGEAYAYLHQGEGQGAVQLGPWSGNSGGGNSAATAVLLIVTCSYDAKMMLKVLAHIPHR